jgi:shikimate 5-dehydrogenase
VGTVTPEMVRQRAREIAIINGRPTNHCTKQDIQEAQRELTGGLASTQDEEDMIISATSWGEEPGSKGYPVEKEEAVDEQQIAQELVEQGMNDAEHDQMVEAAKRHNDY